MKNFVCLILLFLLSLNAEAGVLQSRQWGLINHGQALLQTSGDLTRDEVQGIVGMDINWVKPAEIQARLKAQGSEALEREVVVAVIDSGIDLEHPEFAGRIWENPVCADLDEETRNQRPCHGWNFLKNSADLTDDDGHGTHVAGIIAANHNGQGILGVTPNQIKIMPLKVLSKDVSGFVYEGKIVTDIIADALIFALNNGASVVNMSLGWPKVIHTPRMQAAIEEAYKRGVLLVVATGNNNKDIPTYPCSSPGVICVGAVDNRGEVTEFSNFSGKVDLMAPGESIISTYPRNLESRSLRIQGYELKRGSSQAAPYVAAVGAVIKLLTPEIDLLELQAKIYQSARTLDQKSKSSKYGLLDMRAALDSTQESFVTVDFKDLLEIEIEESGAFEFKLPLINHLSSKKDLAIEIDFFENTQTQKIETLESKERQVLTVKGEIKDWKQDSHGELRVKISQNGEVLFAGKTNIALSRNVEVVESTKMTLKNLHPEVISFFGRQQKASRMRRVSDHQLKGKSVEWFFQDPRLQNGAHSVTDLLVITQGEHQIKRFLTPKMAQLLSIFKIDMNLDGEDDYLFYGLDNERKNIVFYPKTAAGDALFSSFETWTFPISTFEGLPLKNGIEDFAWMKIQHEQLGNILMPSFHRSWTMPEEDNTRDLLDRLNPGVQRRLYFLYPAIKDGNIIVEPRTLENFSFHQALRRQRLLKDFDQITMSKAFDQNLGERAAGVMRMILLIGRESNKRPYILEFTDTKNWKLQTLHIGVTQLEGNLPQAFRDLEAQDYSSTYGFMALLNRSTARLSLLADNNGILLELAKIVQATDSWGDPIFNTLGGFVGDQKRTLFLETRYFVYSMVTEASGETSIQKLPINRDSSFPGMAFAETMKAVAVDEDQNKLPGLMINSSLIYGDRVYVMTQTEQEFKRPVALSFSFPAHCLYLDSENLGGQDYLFLLCRHPNRPLMEQAEIVKIPLEL